MSQKHVASTEQAFVFIHLITTSPKEKETGSRWEPGVRTLQVAERQAAGFPMSGRDVRASIGLKR
jgi:hypothetical protein